MDGVGVAGEPVSLQTRLLHLLQTGRTPHSADVSPYLLVGCAFVFAAMAAAIDQVV